MDYLPELTDYLTNEQRSFMHTLAAPAAHAEEEFGVPANVTLAVALISTNFGHNLPPGSFNVFQYEQPPQFEPSVTFEVKRIVNGKLAKVGLRFKVYQSYQQSFDDYCRTAAKSKLRLGEDEKQLSEMPLLLQAVEHAKKEFRMKVIAGVADPPVRTNSLPQVGAETNQPPEKPYNAPDSESNAGETNTVDPTVFDEPDAPAPDEQEHEKHGKKGRSKK